MSWNTEILNNLLKNDLRYHTIENKIERYDMGENIVNKSLKFFEINVSTFNRPQNLLQNWVDYAVVNKQKTHSAYME